MTSFFKWRKSKKQDQRKSKTCSGQAAVSNCSVRGCFPSRLRRADCRDLLTVSEFRVACLMEGAYYRHHQSQPALQPPGIPKEWQPTSRSMATHTHFKKTCLSLSVCVLVSVSVCEKDNKMFLTWLWHERLEQMEVWVWYDCYKSSITH